MKYNIHTFPLKFEDLVKSFKENSKKLDVKYNIDIPPEISNLYFRERDLLLDGILDCDGFFNWCKNIKSTDMNELRRLRSQVTNYYHYIDKNIFGLNLILGMYDVASTFGSLKKYEQARNWAARSTIKSYMCDFCFFFLQTSIQLSRICDYKSLDEITDNDKEFFNGLEEMAEVYQKIMKN